MSADRRFLVLEHEVSLILAETSAAADAYPKLLESVGTSLGWDFGAIWEETDGPECLRTLRRSP